ncbi:hypothetical protein DEM91_12115 [Prevotella sp. TCVGH]|jgi:hypothetical protein|uniref:hypothetical protein n=1 Tax=Prevotella sp. TCVGH TaxID=2182433 RepID=UPI00201D738E|nr:hypothetical protein [Prevotella sp. TCVGH]MCL6749328.1 hypothetical protein [Prevotella sp. TCVGH]
MKRSIIIFLLVPFFLVSCQIAGLTSGYSHLSKKEQAKIINYKGKIDEIHDYSKIYTVTVEQVKEYLSNHNNVIIYDYTPFCKSSFCFPPNILEDICKKNNTDLLVISNIYDDIFLGITNNFPILMIKTSVYNTKSRAKYIDKFYHSLIGLNLKEIDYASYHYFSNGNYIKSFKNPKDISL